MAFPAFFPFVPSEVEGQGQNSASTALGTNGRLASCN